MDDSDLENLIVSDSEMSILSSLTSEEARSGAAKKKSPVKAATPKSPAKVTRSGSQRRDYAARRKPDRAGQRASAKAASKATQAAKRNAPRKRPASRGPSLSAKPAKKRRSERQCISGESDSEEMLVEFTKKTRAATRVTSGAEVRSPGKSNGFLEFHSGNSDQDDVVLACVANARKRSPLKQPASSVTTAAEPSTASKRAPQSKRKSNEAKLNSPPRAASAASMASSQAVCSPKADGCYRPYSPRKSAPISSQLRHELEAAAQESLAAACASASSVATGALFDPVLDRRLKARCERRLAALNIVETAQGMLESAVQHGLELSESARTTLFHSLLRELRLRKAEVLVERRKLHFALSFSHLLLIYCPVFKTIVSQKSSSSISSLRQFEFTD